MRKTVHKKSIIAKFFKALLGGLFIVFLGTAGMDAADHRGNLSESVIGKLIFGKSGSRCPAEMVFVSSETGGFCIDKFENSAGDGCNIKNPSTVSESQDSLNIFACQPVSVVNASPWTNITQDQAIRACAKVGKRLPTNKEWQAAALGTPDPDKDWGVDDCQVAKNWPSQPGLTGSGQKCISYSGAFDMIGNVWEWVSGAVVDGKFEGRELPASGYISAMNASDAMPSATSETPSATMFNDQMFIKNTETRGILRGGYFDNKSDAGQYAVYAVTLPNNWAGTMGFRCVK
ncbi:MAG: SUMF1/EgtB/PvdO family nonheme iron enzyme [bacterium]